MEIINCDVFKDIQNPNSKNIYKKGYEVVLAFPEIIQLFTYDIDTTLDGEGLDFLSDIAVFKIKCLWDAFEIETISNFNNNANIVYFARKVDYLIMKDNEAIYEVNLKSTNHIGKIVFCMPNVESVNEDYKEVYTRVFLPKLKLNHIDKINKFEIRYSQSKTGLGFENDNENISNQTEDCFYFNKPFFVHISIDLIHILSIYIHGTKYNFDTSRFF